MFESVINFLRRFFSMFGASAGGGKHLTFPQKQLKVAISTAVLGEGGFSTVYQAKDNGTGKTYAVKKVLVQTEEIQRSVRTELKAFQKFTHPNILPLVDWFETRNERNIQVFYLLFPLMKKGSLRDELNSSIQSDPNRIKRDIGKVLKDFQSVCSAFQYMHTCSPSFIHQDIKPENILIADNGEPLLCDFGSVREADVTVDTRAKALAVLEEAAQFCTMPYRAIELFDPPTGSQLDSRTDVWGMGCLLFACWFGYSPFECEFTPTGAVKVVECSLTRVLAKIPRPAKPSENDKFIADFAEYILVGNPQARPFCVDVIDRLKRTTVSGNKATTDMAPV